MQSRHFPHRRLAIMLSGLAVFVTASPALAAPRVLVVDGGRVHSEPAAGAEPAGQDAPPSAAAGLSAAAARATAKPKKKKPAPAFNLKVIRKQLNALGGAPTRRYDARAALTSVDTVARKLPKSSQARRELENVLKITTIMARTGRNTSDRLPMLTETLKRNAEWWKLRKATATGQRVQFDGSQMLWQYYPGSGMQLQWLGTFGRGNALYYSGTAVQPDLAALADEALRLAVPRAGGVSWEYFFPFGGGSPPWVSGMAEATGIQVLARASTKLVRPDLLVAAKSAMGILKAAPPSGVQLAEPTGTFFLIYSYAKDQKVLNAMNQTINGLYAYVLAAPDDVDARLLLLSGLQWLDANVFRYDTGKYTLYQLGGPTADAHYHEVATGFLKTLCALLKTDAVTPGGGPTGAFSSTRICRAADVWSGYSK